MPCRRLTRTLILNSQLDADRFLYAACCLGSLLLCRLIGGPTTAMCGVSSAHKRGTPLLFSGGIRLLYNHHEGADYDLPGMRCAAPLLTKLKSMALLEACGRLRLQPAAEAFVHPDRRRTGFCRPARENLRIDLEFPTRARLSTLTCSIQSATVAPRCWRMAGSIVTLVPG